MKIRVPYGKRMSVRGQNSAKKKERARQRERLISATNKNLTIQDSDLSIPQPTKQNKNEKAKISTNPPPLTALRLWPLLPFIISKNPLESPRIWFLLPPMDTQSFSYVILCRLVRGSRMAEE